MHVHNVDDKIFPVDHALIVFSTKEEAWLARKFLNRTILNGAHVIIPKFIKMKLDKEELALDAFLPPIGKPFKMPKKLAFSEPTADENVDLNRVDSKGSGKGTRTNKYKPM